MVALNDMIGQCFLIGFRGAELAKSNPVVADIRKRNLAGVILFDRFLAGNSQSNNILNAEQTARLIADLQNEAGDRLLVAVDQEGGMVSRFKEDRGFPTTLPAAQLGQFSDTEATRQAAEQTAGLLAGLGINLNLAPVADLNSFTANPIIGKYQRSFSADPAVVSRHVEVWIRAHHQHAVRCCLKHFPGHGSARTDSHLGFVDISTVWQNEELIPFAKMIEAGCADAIMTGHLYHRALDSQWPATLSASILNGLLREQMGFAGVIISDDLQMQAITSRYGLEEAAWMALAAGVDLLIFGNNLHYDPDLVKKCTVAIVSAVRRGDLSEERIYQAWQRVQRLKQLPR